MTTTDDKYLTARMNSKYRMSRTTAQNTVVELKPEGRVIELSVDPHDVTHAYKAREGVKRGDRVLTLCGVESLVNIDWDTYLPAIAMSRKSATDENGVEYWGVIPDCTDCTRRMR